MICTVVNLLQYKLAPESKPGLIPDSFTIPPADEKFPGVLYVADAKSHLYLDHDRGTFAITHQASQVAESIVKDFIQSQLGYTIDAHPGMFWVEGKHTPEEILAKFSEETKQAKAKQYSWFTRLISIADDEWQRYHQHKMISDMQRHAAKMMNLKREWAETPIPVEIIKCPACQTQIPSNAIVCMNCKNVINTKASESLVFAK